MSRLGNTRQGLVNRAVGLDLRGTMNGMQESLHRVEDNAIRTEERIARLEAMHEEDRARQLDMARQLGFIERRLTVELERLRMQRDDIPGLRGRLREARLRPEYLAAFEEREPLISVRIPAYRKTEELIDSAIASVLAQTYQRFEIIVVNDGPNEKTARAIEAIGDDRIHYEEFAAQSVYPADRHSRWMVAGSPGMNRAVELATGTWIAPLDDDDAFSPDHLEKLLALALEQRVELAYGALRSLNAVTGEERRIWSYPPAISQFSFMGAIYLRQLDFFRYDESSWLVDEPGDWNLIRRMSEAGVTMAATEDLVGTINLVPYTHKD
ncbi:MAG: glycosyltransferase family 2 protein [Actinobacteria bacterium]|nr:glycosyltransferase family 2 protein [Actinomycetota bacterium]